MSSKMKYSKIQLLLFMVLLASSKSLRLRRRPQRTFARPVHPVFIINRPKIVGGIEATPHSIPYQAAISFTGYFCGGSLISREHVLTAAHCAVHSNNPIIILGAHDLFAYEEETEQQQIIPAKRSIIHENYQADLLENDIALIFLEKQATLNAYVKTIPVAQSDAPTFEGSLLQVSGWGKTRDADPGITDALRVAWIQGISNSDCKKIYGNNVHDGMLCADTSTGDSTCAGDSGGPLVDVDCDVLVGISSFVHTAGCETGHPAGFTRVSYYAEWIETGFCSW